MSLFDLATVFTSWRHRHTAETVPSLQQVSAPRVDQLEDAVAALRIIGVNPHSRMAAERARVACTSVFNLVRNASRIDALALSQSEVAVASFKGTLRPQIDDYLTHCNIAMNIAQKISFTTVAQYLELVLKEYEQSHFDEARLKFAEALTVTRSAAVPVLSV